MKMTFRGYMENERKKNIIFIAAITFCIILSANVCNSVKSYKYGRLCNQYREQLIAAETTNRELADKIGRITEITGKIKGTTNANITDAREIIETIEILRTQIQELENICYGYDTLDSYYNYWDNEFGISQ